jgi:hypothetical protein
VLRCNFLILLDLQLCSGQRPPLKFPKRHRANSFKVTIINYQADIPSANGLRRPLAETRLRIYKYNVNYTWPVLQVLANFKKVCCCYLLLYSGDGDTQHSQSSTSTSINLLLQYFHKHVCVFAAPATGFVGSSVAKDLLAAGHQVVGLARSDASEEILKDQGVEVLHSSLDDLDSLRRGENRIRCCHPLPFHL